MRAERVRVGLVGFGKMGALHARSVAELPGAELVGVCDTDPAALERARARYGVHVTTDLDALLALRLDAVIVASSTPQHPAHIRAAARAGLAVFTEKPVGLTLADTDDVLQEVVDAGIAFQIGFQRRWDAHYLRVRDVIAAGDIGEPVLFKAHGRDPDASRPENWGLDRNGGLFLNCAIHDFDAARFLMDRQVEALCATGATLVHKGLSQVGDIDTCSTSLFLGGEAMALTEWSRYAAYGYDIGVEVVGTAGVVQLGGTRDAAVVVHRRSQRSPTVFDVFGDAYRDSLAGFLAAVRDGVPARPGVEDARAALHIALLARASFQAGSRLTEVPPLPALRRRALEAFG